MRSTAIEVALRLGISATLAVSSVIHAYLYIHGYRHIPTVGPAFLLQASVFCALAVLILAGAPEWFGWVGAVLSVGTLIAFALSRTAGLFGFTERGWEPPYGPVSTVAQVLTVVSVAAFMLNSRRKTPAI
jgi:hypothetical protein